MRKFNDALTFKKSDLRVYMYETWHSLHSGKGRGLQWSDEDHILLRTRNFGSIVCWNTILDKALGLLNISNVLPATYFPVPSATT